MLINSPESWFPATLRVQAGIEQDVLNVAISALVSTESYNIDIPATSLMEICDHHNTVTKKAAKVHLEVALTSQPHHRIQCL